jgi:hypothetical protein
MGSTPEGLKESSSRRRRKRIGQNMSGNRLDSSAPENVKTRTVADTVIQL